MKYVEQKLYEKVIDFVTTCHDIPFHALSEWHYYIIIAIIITDTQKFKYHGAMEESSSDTRRVSVNWKTISDYVCVSQKNDFSLKMDCEETDDIFALVSKNLFSSSISLANTQVEKQFYIVYRVYFCEMAEVYMKTMPSLPSI